MSITLAVLTLVGTLPDRGIFPDLGGAVNLAAPRAVDHPARAWLRLDRRHGLATLYDGDDPLVVYPLVAGGLAASDAAAVAALVGGAPRRVVGAPGRDEDRDGDGIVDRLDVVVGAKKLVHNGARYLERYRTLAYPGGDVPRDEGVCSDTVIRALRNAGLDLQREVHEDILRAPAAYPMVDKIDPSINHRRVRTLLPWFRRHWQLVAPDAPARPGDVVFFDTLPERAGPDHVGVVGDTPGASGALTVINNWAPGARDAEMDLLSSVPVTHRFRWPHGDAR